MAIIASHLNAEVILVVTVCKIDGLNPVLTSQELMGLSLLGGQE